MNDVIDLYPLTSDLLCKLENESSNIEVTSITGI